MKLMCVGKLNKNGVLFTYEKDQKIVNAFFPK
jgi:hypothetical protein